MNKTLNRDVLKRTTGLLSQIDETLRIGTIAERVDRVLQSAAPAIANPTFPSFDDWMTHHGNLESTGDHEYDSDFEMNSNLCGCEWVTLEKHGVDRRGEEYTYRTREMVCYLDETLTFPHLEKMDVDGLHVEPWTHGHRAADVPCGAEGCECIPLFPPHCYWCDMELQERDGVWVDIDNTWGDGCPVSPIDVHVKREVDDDD